MFRPGGHGALIENLNDQDADIIFIKNIDNVVVDANLKAVADNKKMLAGCLLQLQKETFKHLLHLEKGKLTAEELVPIAHFAAERLNIRFPDDYDQKDNPSRQQWLLKRLKRPIRVCGMVKNEGEPGGGPFFIKDAQGKISLQIVESAQIDTDDKDQAAILRNATHFNPVDLVCGLRDHHGEKYDLLDFVDPKQGFITEKTKDGKSLKAWNYRACGMAPWRFGIRFSLRFHW